MLGAGLAAHGSLERRRRARPSAGHHATPPPCPPSGRPSLRLLVLITFDTSRGVERGARAPPLRQSFGFYSVSHEGALRVSGLLNPRLPSCPDLSWRAASGTPGPPPAPASRTHRPSVPSSGIDRAAGRTRREGLRRTELEHTSRLGSRERTALPTGQMIEAPGDGTLCGGDKGCRTGLLRDLGF
eukprot:1177560-Prorocentrum_minimum.AAC.2